MSFETFSINPLYARAETRRRLKLRRIEHTISEAAYSSHLPLPAPNQTIVLPGEVAVTQEERMITIGDLSQDAEHWITTIVQGRYVDHTKQFVQLGIRQPGQGDEPAQNVSLHLTEGSLFHLLRTSLLVCDLSLDDLTQRIPQTLSKPTVSTTPSPLALLPRLASLK